MSVPSSRATEYALKLLPLTHSYIYFLIMTDGLYIIPLIIRLLVKTIEDIPPKYLFLMILFIKIVLHANRTLKFQVLRSNPLLAERYERCELEAQNPLNVGLAHSNQWNFFQHSEPSSWQDLARGPGVLDPCPTE